MIFCLFERRYPALRALRRGSSFRAAAAVKPFLFILAALLLTGCGKSRTSLRTNRNGTLAVDLPGYTSGLGTAANPKSAPPEAIPDPFSADTADFGNAADTGGLVLGNLGDQAGREITLDPAYQRQNEVVEIREKMFLAQTNDVYINPQEYLGKTIKLEGIFQLYDVDPPYYFVIRYGPGCCGNDGYAGFEVAWDPNSPGEKTYPQQNDWVEAVGVLGTYEEDDYPYLCIALSSLTVKQERGAEFVSQ
jgi:hypothetical protein